MNDRIIVLIKSTYHFLERIYPFIYDVFRVRSHQKKPHNTELAETLLISSLILKRELEQEEIIRILKLTKKVK